MGDEREARDRGEGLSDALQQAIVKVCDLEPADVQPETRLQDLGVDSLAVAEIIVELELALDRQFPIHLLRRLDRIETVGDVAAELDVALDELDGERSSTPPG
jgi:acyl carrier protein